MIMSLSDRELISLGVDTIGDRHRLRETIYTKLKNTFAYEPNKTGTNNYITNSRARMAQQKVKVQQPLWQKNLIPLANKRSRSITSATNKEILHKTGLGSAKLCEVNETMGLPQLNNCDGIELLRTSQNCRTLKLIDSCWSVKMLKATVGPEAYICIRQKHLSTKPLSSTSNYANVNAFLHENNSSTSTPLNVSDSSISVILTKAIEYCRTGNISDPVEMLKKLHNVSVPFRPLEVQYLTVCAKGDTYFIIVNMINVLSTCVDEISAITNLIETLEVQFNNESKKGILSTYSYRNNNRYFDNGLRELLVSDYEKISKSLVTLSVLQNGKIPTFISPKYSGRPLTSLFQLQFSEEGTNNNQFEKTVYAAFLGHLRKLSIFISSEPFLPTANTCVNCLTLPRPSQTVKLPDDTTFSFIPLQIHVMD
ncbi:hypothetical protein ACJMK2_044638 [Sinanodonta woodiana]|uniref:SAM domain-containing protein n=1 Tax=Sinanodonta woodiana TaxID=1069815 RepID=A0ABD3W196_SINWO